MTEYTDGVVDDLTPSCTTPPGGWWTCALCYGSNPQWTDRCNCCGKGTRR